MVNIRTNTGDRLLDKEISELKARVNRLENSKMGNANKTFLKGDVQVDASRKFFFGSKPLSLMHLNDVKYNSTSGKLEVLGLQTFKTKSLFLGEQADASTDLTAYGQLWVHDDTPCSLWFTTDAGDDIQLTSGTRTVDYLTFGISDTNVTKCGAGIVDDDFIRVNGTTFEGRSAAEVRSDIGAGTSSVANLNDLGDVSYSSGDLIINSLDTIKRTEYSAGTSDGNDLKIEAQNGHGTNSDGGNLILEAGRQTGNEGTADIIFNTGIQNASTGTTLRDSARVGQFYSGGLYVSNSDGSTAGEINLVINGDVTNYTKLSSTGIQTAGNLTLDGGGGSIYLDDDGHTFATFSKSDSSFILHEVNQDASADYFKVACDTNGVTTISTVNALADSGNLILAPDGQLVLQSGTSLYAGIKCDDSLKIKEQADATGDIAGYGQLWVDTATPNELAFTDDAGTDIIGIGKYHYETKMMGFYGGAAYAWLPFAGYIVEGTSTTGRNEYQSFIAPYNGTLVSYQARSEIGQGGSNHSLRINEASDGTEIPGTLIYRKDYDPGGGVGIADDTTINWDFSSPSVGSDPPTFTKGRLYMFYVAFAAAPQDTNITLVFKWDITS